MRKIIGIDPGSSVKTRTNGLVLILDENPHPHPVILWNKMCYPDEVEMVLCCKAVKSLTAVIEHVQFYRTSAQDVRDTAYQVGAIQQSCRQLEVPFAMLERSEIRRFFGAKDDGEIKESLCRRWGGKEAALGGPRCSGCKGKGWAGRGRQPCEVCDGKPWEPGPLHGIKGHEWAALALAVCWMEGGGAA